jgi:hypothetical protein
VKNKQSKTKNAAKQRKKQKPAVSFDMQRAELICALIAEGQSLRKICSLESMPTVSAFMMWLAKGAAGEEPYKTVLEQYARAREAQAELYADEIVDIADDSTQDELFNDEGKRICNAEFVARSKLRVEARKWVAAKLLPKKYGDVTTLKGDKDNPIAPAIFTLNLGKPNGDADDSAS